MASSSSISQRANPIFSFTFIPARHLYMKQLDSPLPAQESLWISELIRDVRSEFDQYDAGHDWWHVVRVWNNAVTILNELKELVDCTVVLLGVILHDIADAKFYDGDESIGPTMARQRMRSYSIDSERVEHVVQIITHMSYKNSLDGITWSSPEMVIVQDADRLDAIGAIGIARAFSYGGFKQRSFYDPALKPQLQLSKEDYKKQQSPTMNHFYEKLLLLKDQFHSSTARRMAEERHQFMLSFVERFYDEWYGDHVPEDPFGLDHLRR